MNRKELLESGLIEDKNVTTVVATTLAKDVKFLKRTKRDLEDAIEDAEENLKVRLSSNTVIDSSVVLITFAKIMELEEQLKLYKSFEASYFTEEK
jgi:hypothetical protein